MINTSVKTTTCDILRNDNKKYNLCYDIGENGSKTYAGFNNMKDLINGINAVQNVYEYMIHEERCLYFDKDFSSDCEYKSSLMTIKEFNTFNKSLFSAIYNKLKNIILQLIWNA